MSIARPMGGLWNMKARRAISRIWLSIDLLDRGARAAVTDRGDLARPSKRQVPPPGRLVRRLPAGVVERINRQPHDVANVHATSRLWSARGDQAPAPRRNVRRDQFHHDRQISLFFATRELFDPDPPRAPAPQPLTPLSETSGAPYIGWTR